MRMLLPFLVLVIRVSEAHEDPCNCVDKHLHSRYRTKEKHERNFSEFPVAKDTITCGDIIAWQGKYAAISEHIASHTSEIPRRSGTPEDSLYILKGWMYFVRHESKKNGDCDLHIEIGTGNKFDMRAVVELTNDNCQSQKIVLDYLEMKGCKLNKEFSKGIPCVVKGLGFYDGNQYPTEHGRIGKTNVSSWELHPLISVEFQ